MTSKQIYCCTCVEKVDARLTDGAEIYPHRQDLRSLPFWKCDTCKCFVGCHHKTKHPTRPLGCIPSKEIKEARKHIHAILDPLWQSKRFGRGQIYAWIKQRLDMKYDYHTAQIRSIEEAREVYRLLKTIPEQGELPA